MNKTPPYRVTFIRKWRQHRDLTLEVVADAVGMTKTSLSRIERGWQPYTQPTLEAIARTLRVQDWQLLRDDPTVDSDVIDLMLLPPASRTIVRRMIDPLKDVG